MSRPLNKRYFGPPTDAKNEIKVQFFNGTASVPGWIVKQTGSKRFKCSDGTEIKTCYLADEAAADLAEGQMSITVKNDAGNVKRIKKVAGRKLTHFDGTIGYWSFSTSTSDGKVEIEEAGEDESLTNSTNLEGDVE
jgi:hypothetical protein